MGSCPVRPSRVRLECIVGVEESFRQGNFYVADLVTETPYIYFFVRDDKGSWWLLSIDQLIDNFVIMHTDDNLTLNREPTNLIKKLGKYMTEKKPSNPKDAVGIKKYPMSVVPAQVLAEVSLGLMEGSRKYGRHNYREAGVRASVYYDATQRHLMDWWEGTDIDPDSGLSHITKAIASLVVLRDAMINDMVEDDRPPALKGEWVAAMNKKAEEIIEKYPNPLPAVTNKNVNRPKI